MAVVSIGGIILWKIEGMRFYNVQTASMAPLIQAGDLVITNRVPNPRAGDIISYTSPQNPAVVITHRIILANPSNGYLITRGDNLRSADPPTSYASVKGKAVKVVPKAGYALSALHNPFGLIGLIYLPALLIAALELSRLMRHFSRRTYGVEV